MLQRRRGRATDSAALLEARLGRNGRDMQGYAGMAAG